MKLTTATDQERPKPQVPVICVVLMIFLSSLPGLVSRSVGQYAIESSVVSAGGGDASADSLELTGTLGQPLAGGYSSGPPYHLYSGFWSPGLQTTSTSIPFVETFANNDAGWTLDEEWQIGPAMTSTGHESGNPDPGSDTTATMDNGVAGIVIGGNASIKVHGFRYLTSPPIDVEPLGPGTSLILSFNRWLNSDRTPWMNNRVDVWNGTAWITIWESGSTFVRDSAWIPQSFDITAYQNPALRVRFGMSTGTDGTNPSWIVSSWNIDDLKIIVQSHIEVRGNGLPVINGDETPSLSDGTDFGSVDVSGSSATRTFSIVNLGSSELNLTGSPLVEISGPHAADFSVTVAPTTPIGVGGSSQMSLAFTPSALGLRTATVSIANDVPNASPYTFMIQGTGMSITGLHFRAVSSGDWSNTFTWEQSTDAGDTWNPASTTPTAANSDSISIDGFTVTVTTAINVDQLVQTSGVIETEAGGTITVNDGPGNDMTVSSLNSILNLNLGSSLVNNGQVAISGYLQIWDGSAIAGNALQYSFPGFLIYVAGTHTTTDLEFPAENSPAAVGVAGAEVTLHAPRTVLYVGLTESGVFNIGTNLTLANDASVERYCAACILNGTPIFEERLHLSYFFENMTTGSEVPEEAYVLQGVLLDGVNELTIASDMTVNEILDLRGGKVVTNEHVLTLNTAFVEVGSPESGYIIGNLRKVFSLEPGLTTRTFEVGTANGYSPVTLNYNISMAGNYEQTVRAARGSHPNLSDPQKALSRYWTLSEISGPGAASTDITFNYLDPIDIPETASELNFVIQKYNGVFTQPEGTIDAVANTATALNVTSFSDWTLAEPSAIPSVIIVDTLVDDGTLNACTEAPGDCSLRGAVAIAKDGTTITFEPALFALDLVPTGGPATLVLGGTSIVIGSDLNIEGPGPGLLSISGNNLSRVFTVSSGAIVAISGMTITGGNSGASNGGGVITAGAVTTIERVHFLNNTGSAGGGLSGSNFVVRSSTFSGNIATGVGGAIHSLFGTLTISNTTISGNTVNNINGRGGGIYLGDLVIATLRSVTITTNTAQTGGGVTWVGGVASDLHIGNSIISGNNGILGADEIDNGDLIVSEGFNLIGSTVGANITLQPSDIVGQDPLLGTLANNGGSTPTHALLPGSPALDAGSAFGLTTDQRGTPRPHDLPDIPNADDGTDIGAFEFLSPTAASVSLGGRVTDAHGRGIQGARLTLTDSSGGQRTAISSPFGYYSFEGINAGGSYIVSVSSRRHTFAMPQILITADSDIADLDFVASGP